VWDPDDGWNEACSSQCQCACFYTSPESFLSQTVSAGTPWWFSDFLVSPVLQDRMDMYQSNWNWTDYWNRDSYAMLSSLSEYLSSRGVGYRSNYRTGIFKNTPCMACRESETYCGLYVNGYYTLRDWKNLNIQTVCEPDPPQCMDLPFEKYSYTSYFQSQHINRKWVDSNWPGTWGQPCSGPSVKDMVSSIIDEITRRFGPPVFPTGNINPYPKNIFFINASEPSWMMGEGYGMNISTLARGLNSSPKWINSPWDSSGWQGMGEHIIEIVGEFVRQYDERYGKEVTNRLFNPCQQYIAPDITEPEPSDFYLPQFNYFAYTNSEEPEEPGDDFCWSWNDEAEASTGDPNWDSVGNFEWDCFGYQSIRPYHGEGAQGPCTSIERLFMEWGGRSNVGWDYYQSFYWTGPYDYGGGRSLNVAPYSIFESYLGDDAHPIRGPFSFGSYAPYGGFFWDLDPRWDDRRLGYINWDWSKLDIPLGLSTFNEAIPPPTLNVVGVNCDNRELQNYDYIENPYISPLDYKPKAEELHSKCNEYPQVISKDNQVTAWGKNEGMCFQNLSWYEYSSVTNGYYPRRPFRNLSIGNPEDCEPYERWNYETAQDEIFYPCVDYWQPGFAYDPNYDEDDGGYWGWWYAIAPNARWQPGEENNLGDCWWDFPPESGGSNIGVPTEIATAIYNSPCPYNTPEECEAAQQCCIDGGPGLGCNPDSLDCQKWLERDCGQCLGYDRWDWFDTPSAGTVSFYNHGNIKNILNTNVLSYGHEDYMIALTTVLNTIHRQEHCDCEKEILFGRTCTGVFLPENGFWSSDDILRQPFFWKVKDRMHVGPYWTDDNSYLSGSIHDRPYCDSYATNQGPWEDGIPTHYGFLEGLLQRYYYDYGYGASEWVTPPSGEDTMNTQNHFCTFDMLPSTLVDYADEPVDLQSLGKCAEIYEWDLCPY